MNVKVSYEDALVERMRQWDVIRNVVDIAKDTLGDLPERMTLTIVIHTPDDRVEVIES
jgi:hypothetical protein